MREALDDHFSDRDRPKPEAAFKRHRKEIEALARARIDEAIRRLDLVKREELDAMAELAANARAGQEAAEAQLHEVQRGLAALEARVAALEAQKDAG